MENLGEWGTQAEIFATACNTIENTNICIHVGRSTAGSAISPWGGVTSVQPVHTNYGSSHLQITITPHLSDSVDFITLLIINSIWTHNTYIF